MPKAYTAAVTVAVSKASLGLHLNFTPKGGVIMARAKRKSAVLETARRRLAGLKSIKPAPNYGPLLTEAILKQKADALDARLSSYNQMLSEADTELNGIEADEDEMTDYNRRFLSATEGQYGPDSSEYEAMGGTRTSDRKKRTPKGSGGTGSPPKT